MPAKSQEDVERSRDSLSTDGSVMAHEGTRQIPACCGQIGNLLKGSGLSWVYLPRRSGVFWFSGKTADGVLTLLYKHPCTLVLGKCRIDLICKL